MEEGAQLHFKVSHMLTVIYNAHRYCSTRYKQLHLVVHIFISVEKKETRLIS